MQIPETPPVDLEPTPAYKLFETILEELERTEEAEKVVIETGSLNREVVCAIEHKFPGLITSEIPIDIRYEDEGYNVCLESFSQKKKALQDQLVIRALTMIETLKKMGTRLSNSTHGEELKDIITDIRMKVVGYEPEYQTHKDRQWIRAYRHFMGVDPRSIDEVKKLTKDLTKYNHPIECLRQYPSKHYDDLFCTLLVNMANNKRTVYEFFDMFNNRYVNEIMNNIDKLQSGLSNVIERQDYRMLSRYTGTIISEEITRSLSEVIIALDVKINTEKPILNQTTKIARQISRQTKAYNPSMKNKGVLTKAISQDHERMDATFKNIMACTNKLSKFDKRVSTDLNRVKTGLQRMDDDRTVRNKLSDMVTTSGRQYSIQYKRILNDINQLWRLVVLFLRMSTSYMTCYNRLQTNMGKFNLKLLMFIKDTSSLDGEILL